MRSGTKRSRSLHARGKPRLIYHGVVFGRQIWLGLRNNRYLCRACGKPFTEVSPFIRPRQRRTKAAERAILESLRARSFKSVQEREGISYGVSSRVLRRCLDPERVTWPEGTIALGIDGHSFRGTRMVNTITDVQSRCPLKILPDSRKASLQRFLRDIPAEAKARIQDANHRVDEARKIEQEACRREIPKKLFVIGQDKLSPREKDRLAKDKELFPSLKEFVNVKYFSHPCGKDISQEHGKDISHPRGKQISHLPSE